MVHIVCFCPALSSSLYLPIRHNPIAKNLDYEIIELMEPG